MQEVPHATDEPTNPYEPPEGQASTPTRRTPRHSRRRFLGLAAGAVVGFFLGGWGATPLVAAIEVGPGREDDLLARLCIGLVGLGAVVGAVLGASVGLLQVRSISDPGLD